MKQYILFIFLIFLLAPAALAQVEGLGEKKQFDSVRIKQVCDNCTFVNITEITYPDSTVALGEVEMTKDGSNYFYIFSNTTKIGTYIVTTCGDPDGTYNCESFDFEISKSGETPSGSNSVLYLIISSLAFGIFFTLMGYWYNKFLLFFAAGAFILSGVMMLYYDTGITNQFINQGLGILFMGVGLLFLLGELVDDWLPQ